MGAGQSSDSKNAQSDAVFKTSYYELLSVQRQATGEEIKKAYRRKALELHPDRNYGNEEEATRVFAEVQSAYEILSDPQERAWYDSHEAAILRGDDGTTNEVHSYENIRVTTADDLARVLRKFNSNVDFSDSPSGFFGFLNEQFNQLAREEEAAAAWDNVDAREWPTFGHKADTHDDVVRRFYAAWVSFSTVKSFAWKDKYKVSEAPDRRVRRLMEKENQNLRQDAIREFNDAVRTFVLFVRKRDPRYKPSTQSEAERQQMLRDAAAAQAARARAANLATMQGEVPAWAQYREPSELEESSEEEAEEEIIECVACNKTFKSERQYEAHEKSKKHQKAIQSLQRQMQKDDAKLDLGQSEAGTANEKDWEIIDASGELESDEVVELNQEVAIEDKQAPVEVHQDHDGPDRPLGCVTKEQQANIPLGDEDATVAGLHDLKLAAEEVAGEDEGQQSSVEDHTSDKPKKMGKAAQKRAKKAATKPSASTEENNHKCATCDAAFPSRTRLFQHIKTHGHAALKTGSGTAKAKKGQKKP